jgi:hypothetical protein
MHERTPSKLSFGAFIFCFQNSVSSFNRLVVTERVDAAAVLKVKGIV